MSIPQLGERIPLVGREKEIELLKKYLYAPGSVRHYLYFWARGGLGKTRLLEELERIVREEAGPRFYFSGIIDLYHTDMHSTSDLERVIIEGLDPEQHYFAEYRQERKTYELLRERGADPGILEERRQKLGDLFVKGCNDMAGEAARLVICFDTIELLQYESSIVEEKAGLDIADTRVKPWLLDKLARLRNVVVVFAGRPKLPAPDETVDPQARLVADMQKAFGDNFTEVELKPFTFEETCAFLKHFEAQTGQKLVPETYLNVVHRLTGGRPILLHLIVDWLTILAPESRTILQLFDQYRDLTEVNEDDPQLETARQDIERRILDTILNDSGEIGGYLANIALMPKGVDAEILNVALGMPREEAQHLLERLKPLSFIKQYKSPGGVAPLRGEQIFLHDELYRLLTSQNVIPFLRLNERRIANTLMQDYYNPRIAGLKQQLEQVPPKQRLPLREQWQKLQVERLYYKLVADPREGYAEYKRLTEEANRRRWVGFAMRLLDEFLRFYNDATLERRKLFEAVGITNLQIVRESAWMWVARFDWWGQDDRAIELAERILTKSEDFLIQCSADISECSEQDLVVMSNILAYWAGARARRHGYESATVEKALKMLECLPPLEECVSEQALAYARLATAIGFQYRLGGLLEKAVECYIHGKTAFLKLEDLKDHYEEYTLLLQNLATVYAKQGLMELAIPLAHEALRINEEIGSEYSTGLTLITLSQIAHMRTNYQKALTYGEEALEIFKGQGDERGIVLAQLAIVRAKRWIAKHEMEKERKSKFEYARQLLEESRNDLEKSLSDPQKANIGSVIPDLYAELGRVYRDLAQYNLRLQKKEIGFYYYHQAEQHLQSALERAKWGVVDRADTRHDLAEVLFALGDADKGRIILQEIIKDLTGQDYQISPEEKNALPDGLPREYFRTLGGVELLEGSNALKGGCLVEGVKHYVLAYACFVRFSPEAIETTKMVEYLYNYLRDLPLDRRRETMTEVQKWVEQTEFVGDVGKFVKNVADLLGV